MKAFLHIPKTAGLAIGTAIYGALSIEETSPISVFGHEYNLRDLEGHGVAFCIRDPVDRVISGFYSRLRMGRPRNNIPHTRDEAKTFRRWPTFVDLATEVVMGKHRAERADDYVLYRECQAIRRRRGWAG